MDANANANANVNVNANANANANADAGGSTIALREHCSGELKTYQWLKHVSGTDWNICMGFLHYDL